MGDKDKLGIVSEVMHEWIIYGNFFFFFKESIKVPLFGCHCFTFTMGNILMPFTASHSDLAIKTIQKLKEHLTLYICSNP